MKGSELRIHVLSDLHLEFVDFERPRVDADVLVLAGDVHTQERGRLFAGKWAEEIPTLYVAGNHEFYGTALPKLYDNLRSATSYPSLHFLECTSVVIGQVRFLGCTLWTDFGLLGADTRELAMLVSQTTITDYKKIRVSPEYRKLKPAYLYACHRKSLAWLERSLAEPFDGPNVVITHHAPSLKSIAPSDSADVISASYASNLEDVILRSNITLWIHGHTHYCVDYQIGSTRVVANPRGYPGEASGGFNPRLVVTL